MTENKRFILIDGVKRGTHSGIWDKQKQNNKRTGDELWIGEVVEWLNELHEENEQLKWSNKILRVNKKDCELGRRNEIKRWEALDKDRLKCIRILQKRLKKHGLSPYIVEDFEMTEKRFQIIHLGNPYDFVVKDHQTNRTYGHFQGDDKSLQECLDNIADENEELKQQIKDLNKYIDEIGG